MSTVLVAPSDAAPTLLRPVTKAGLEAWKASAPEATRAWVTGLGFSAEAGTFCPLPEATGAPAQFLVGLGTGDDPWCLGALPDRLPDGLYRFAPDALDPAQAEQAALAWALGGYAFTRFKARTKPFARLVWPEGIDHDRVLATAQAATLVRDLINRPAADLGPGELAEAALEVAAGFGAECKVIAGDELLSANWPAVHAVGRGAARPPCLIDIRWGDPQAPKLTLVGKGVCFDSGGLDLKSSANMRLMKKDMGGAAHALGLARLVMGAGRPVRLRVLIPAVENLVSAQAMRPGDVLATRKGLSVEVGNTDAEGRLILADALAEADSETPDLLIDFATLTGAARAALGTDIPALFTDDDALAADLARHSTAQFDPLWRLPLWKGYRKQLDSAVADLSNDPKSGYGGAITAALFLQAFVEHCPRWVHVDMMAWNTASRPGRPEGGEAMGLRAFFALLGERYAVEKN